MNDVKEPKVTIEEAFELTKKHLLFTISDNEDKSTYYEAMGLSEAISSCKDIGNLGLQMMQAPNKTDIAKLVLENSNSLAEVIVLLHLLLETNFKMGQLLEGSLRNLMRGLQGDKEDE